VLSTGNLRLDAAAQTNAGLLLAGQTLDLIATTLSNSGTLQAGNRTYRYHWRQHRCDSWPGYDH
jgi:hypothetical protein